MSATTIPAVGPHSDLDSIQTLLDSVQAKITLERERRARMSKEQRVAEKLSTMLSHEPGETWHYEGDDWTKPEHRRWLAKAEALLAVVPDEDEAVRLVQSIR